MLSGKLVIALSISLRYESSAPLNQRSRRTCGKTMIHRTRVCADLNNYKLVLTMTA